ncbi:hypothetical protein BwSH20_60180 [Bradyrhizobium ottawaense]|nr:hypothetical protein SG09_32160 [Bradyrhizobium ottawaense]GMO45913.1 hypothetical protein BwSF21_61800 [Bradyrhizobium ottawaense]GMO49215.1 hypothetical protein BwSF12_57700 [Bradyrhizobium ottawaense]GMO64995.1 hypothetical protein BwSG10_16780 [Bradyrhizobium ottawaense]GMO70706.1 hypothetical protein BwSF19_08170 [Bradyrhizobium ottawaense]
MFGGASFLDVAVPICFAIAALSSFDCASVTAGGAATASNPARSKLQRVIIMFMFASLQSKTLGQIEMAPTASP